MDKRRIAMLFERATRYSVVLLWPVFMAAYIYTGDVIRSLDGGRGFESSVTLARLLSYPYSRWPWCRAGAR